MSGASNELSTNGMTWKDELRRLFAQTQVEMWKYFLLEKNQLWTKLNSIRSVSDCLHSSKDKRNMGFNFVMLSIKNILLSLCCGRGTKGSIKKTGYPLVLSINVYV